MTGGKKTLLVIGGILVALILVGLAFRFSGSGGVPSRTVLELDLERSYPEAIPENPFDLFSSDGRLSLRDLTETLERAGSDSRVSGLVAHVGAAPMGMAQVQEIRDAVLAFRAKGKFAVAASETFGEFGPGNAAYYLATAFDEILLQPSGDVGLNGLVAESPFIRGTLDKLGVKPEFDHRYEYKNAMNTYTETKMTPAHREAIGKVISSFYDQMVRGIAQGRKKTPEDVRTLIDGGPYLGPEALEHKLVDGLLYWDEAAAKVKARAGAGAHLLYVSRYAKRGARLHDRGPRTIALIYGVGGVARGKSSNNPFSGATMGSDTVTSAFRKAVEDPSVAAILFRVDSPGGSYVASDSIWRETVRAKKAGKPVVVSMGDVAGSGGYFVAMAADKIVAQPGTITGSIGVLGGKMVTPGMWEKLGLTFDQVALGAHANMWNSSRSFSPEEWQRFQAWLDRVYVDFTTKVAEGRKLQKEKVLEIAKGRIWSGADAKAIGLVDELGGLDTALKLAKKAAKISESESVKVTVFPRPRTPFEALSARLSGDESESSESSQGAEAAVRAFAPLVQRLRAAGVLGPPPGVLSMPEAVLKP